MALRKPLVLPAGTVSELPAADALSSADVEGAALWHGFPIPYEVILSYDATARQVTITPTGAAFDIWINGIRFTKTGAQSSTAHANTTGNYFIYYDAAGTLQVSTDPWDIVGDGIPVCYVYYNSALVDAIALFELHTATRNPAWHKSQHFAIGTFIKSGLEISGVALNTDTDAALTYAIASGVIVDEDIDYTVSALSEGGPYTILVRTGATNWTWTTNNTLPFRFTTNGYINYNQNNGGSYQLTELASSRWVNYYVFATTALAINKQLLIIPGQAVHTSFSSAQIESVASISWGGILIPEIVGVWKLTYETKSNNNTTGKVRLVEVARLSLTRSQLTGNFTAGTHNALTGRDAADSHPIAAITGLQTALDAKLNITAMRVPFYDSTSALDTIPLNSDGSFPFFDSTGAVDNIPLVT